MTTHEGLRHLIGSGNGVSHEEEAGEGDNPVEVLPDLDVSDLVGFDAHVKNAARRTVKHDCALGPS